MKHLIVSLLVAILVVLFGTAAWWGPAGLSGEFMRGGLPSPTHLWACNEGTGTTLNDTGTTAGWDLTLASTPTWGAGYVEADFANASHGWEAGDGEGNTIPGADFTVEFWVYLNSAGSFGDLFVLGDGGGANPTDHSFIIRQNSTSGFKVFPSDDTSTSDIQTGGTTAAAVKYVVFMTYDESTSTSALSFINPATPNTIETGTPKVRDIQIDATFELRNERTTTLGNNARYYKMAIYDKVLSNNEMTLVAATGSE